MQYSALLQPATVQFGAEQYNEAIEDVKLHMNVSIKTRALLLTSPATAYFILSRSLAKAVVIPSTYLPINKAP